jgi:microcystin-dependent protein
MSEPFIGEMRVVAFDFAPRGWLQCAGQTLQVRQYQPLASLLGKTYGGDGVNTFGLPDLRGRAPVGFSGGQLYQLGVKAGEETHMLTGNEVPPHAHALQASPSTNAVAPPNAHLLGSSATVYAPPSKNTVNLLPTSVSSTGGVPHENRQPFTVLNVIIAFNGVYPSRN